MQKNVGETEKTARLLGGLVFVGASMATVAFGASLGPSRQSLIAALALLIAAVLLASAGAQTCPLNRLLGRDTYERDGPDDA
ncbi:YgaP-like transmembrane domain [Natronorubrum sulfidifaciens]|uniref:Inner membrane protein YgaP-like transmembrane domain-containing protein n=1 Tax=Natronorubrum sulfidifaciens JCM 14089 TaxID=1230460 RepID=L9W452_9EURY|nr:YgaP-like transmembrane domain [Natronorubrum sulfidifaciens]ELY44041.1 hypothetical protein C495_12015 [Natronorubrum sulfidifaciens JCM 14089]